MGYQQIRWDSQMKNFLLNGIWHPQPQHQGPKGVGHLPHLGLGEHSQGKMGQQQGRYYFELILLLVGMRHRQHRHQGPKGVAVGHVLHLEGRKVISRIVRPLCLSFKKHLAMPRVKTGYSSSASIFYGSNLFLR